MIKILFLIHDLGQGGAEKVLVNLVNNMDPEKFDISVTALFGGGVNEQFLKHHIRYRTIYPRAFPGNSHVMKLLTPSQLHRMYVKEHYDIEVAYLEGPPSRIISGCSDPDTRLVTWIHCTMKSEREFALGFRSFNEAKRCYARFDRSIFVSRDVLKAFAAFCPSDTMKVCYNTNETAKMLEFCREEVEPGLFSTGEIHLIGTGKLTPVKGFDRLVRIHHRLRSEGYPMHTWILGIGEEEQKLRSLIREQKVEESFTLLGYRTNPYKYVAKCDLFVCSSHSEGFSTAATEALIVGTPVCTTDVSGMREMLGEHNEWGVVTENDEESLYQGIKRLLDDPALLDHYKEKAAERGKTFSTENTVRAVEEMLGQCCAKTAMAVHHFHSASQNDLGE